MLYGQDLTNRIPCTMKEIAEITLARTISRSVGRSKEWRIIKSNLVKPDPRLFCHEEKPPEQCARVVAYFDPIPELPNCQNLPLSFIYFT